MFDELRKSTTGALDKAKLIFNPAATSAATTTAENETESQASSQQPDRLEELAEYCPQLSFQQRLIGFAVSFSLGCELYRLCCVIRLMLRFTHFQIPSMLCSRQI
jgi:uncharacterized metal-binding protein